MKLLILQLRISSDSVDTSSLFFRISMDVRVIGAREMFVLLSDVWESSIAALIDFSNCGDFFLNCILVDGLIVYTHCSFRHASYNNKHRVQKQKVVLGDHCVVD